jgi:enediyne biosynthesis protein E5
MTTQAVPDLAPPPGAPPVPARANVAGFAVRLAVSGLLLWGYDLVHDRLVALFTEFEKWITAEPTDRTAKALAVTVLSFCLLAVWWRLVKKDKRFYAPLFITYILAVADASYGVLENHASPMLAFLTLGQVTKISPTFVAILAAVAMELALGKFVYGKWPHLASAYISGISVGILIKSTMTWPFVMCALISITSKYVFRIGGRHIWNPSNFGMAIMLLLGADVASYSVQSGNDFGPLVLIWVMGSLILYSLGRLYLPLVFVAAFIPLAFLRAALTNQPWTATIAPVTWPMFQLYIFFMITDPRTTTKARWSQCLVVVLVAVVETVFRLFERTHALYYALFIVGPIANCVEIWWIARHPQPAKPSVPVQPAAG